VSGPASRTGNLSSARRAPPATDTTDQTESTFDLVTRAQAGDRAALDELLVRSLPSVQRWAHGRLPIYARGALDTDDLVQQAAYRTLKRLHLFEPRHVHSLQAYLREAVVNRIRDAVRTQTRRGLKDVAFIEVDPEERRDENTPSPLEEVLKRETVTRYRRGLKQLKPHEQRAVVLRLELEMPYAEIATQLGKPTEAAARMTTKRALNRLARLLKENP
jgi:RNA polymerase sigma-70 factor (ECF subfamily)